MRPIHFGDTNQFISRETSKNCESRQFEMRVHWIVRRWSEIFNDSLLIFTGALEGFALIKSVPNSTRYNHFNEHDPPHQCHMSQPLKKMKHKTNEAVEYRKRTNSLPNQTRFFIFEICHLSLNQCWQLAVKKVCIKIVGNQISYRLRQRPTYTYS